MRRNALIALIASVLLGYATQATVEAPSPPAPKVERVTAAHALAGDNLRMVPPKPTDKAGISRAQALTSVEPYFKYEFSLGLPIEARWGRVEDDVNPRLDRRLVWAVTVHPPSCASSGDSGGIYTNCTSTALVDATTGGVLRIIFIGGP